MSKTVAVTEKEVRTAKVVTEKGLLTPYKAAKIVNEELTKLGLKNIPPQMMYNYTTARVNTGKKAIITYNEKTGEVDADALKVWMVKYIEKRTAPVEETEEA
jgi:hypothetical protein